MSYSSELARFSVTKPSFTLLRCHQQSQIPFPSSPCFGTPLLQELPTERRCRLTTRWETPTRLSPVHKAETTKRHAQTRRKPVDRTVHSPSSSLPVEEGTGSASRTCQEDRYEFISEVPGAEAGNEARGGKTPGYGRSVRDVKRRFAVSHDFQRKGWWGVRKDINEYEGVK